MSHRPNITRNPYTQQGRQGNVPPPPPPTAPSVPPPPPPPTASTSNSIHRVTPVQKRKIPPNIGFPNPTKHQRTRPSLHHMAQQNVSTLKARVPSIVQMHQTPTRGMQVPMQMSNHHRPQQQIRTTGLQPIPHRYPTAQQFPSLNAMNMQMRPQPFPYGRGIPPMNYSYAHNFPRTSMPNPYFRAPRGPTAYASRPPRPPQTPTSYRQSHEDVDRFVDLTKDIISEREGVQMLYGTLKGLLFGPADLQSHVNVGLNIRLERKPGTPGTDIDILKEDDNQVIGTVDVITASAFAPLMDERLVGLKGQVANFEREFFEEFRDFRAPEGRYAARLKLNVYGIQARAQNVALRLSHQRDLIWDHRHATFQLQQVNNTRGRQQNTDLGVELQKVETDFNSIFGDAMDTENLKPMAPGKSMRARLLEYQKVGLHWMVMREARNSGKSLFWEEKASKGYSYWFNTATNKKQSEPPEEFRGGILADDMGLGKTIQTISLICTSMSKAGPTLIVAPLSVLDNWVKQIKDHTHKGSLTAHVYYGSARDTTPDNIANFDVVITTYNIVAQEWSEVFGKRRKKKKKKRKHDDDEDDDEAKSDDDDDDDDDSEQEITEGIHAVEWLRVVLDEAHIIRSRKTQTFKAATALKADCRWCLTGTPVQNKLDDLYSLICFLRVEPLTELAWWKAIILSPLKQQDSTGLEKLRQLLRYVCLRRTKDKMINGKPIVRLPPKSQKIIALEFNKEEAELYRHLEAKSKKKFKNFSSKNTLLSNYAHVLEMLLRLRQCCGHPRLVPANYIDETNGIFSGDDQVEARVNMMLNFTDGDCCLCWKTCVDPIITPCAHIFCRKCLTSALSSSLDMSGNTGECPLCKQKMELDKMIDAEKANMMANAYKMTDHRDDNAPPLPSAKIRALIDYVLNKPYDIDKKGLNKTVVFSQWTSMLDIVGECLDRESIPYVRLDGSMMRKHREQSFLAFQNDPNILVFLLSLKAGNLGLNLTAANRVFLLDPWWNPSAEDQAVDRVHRLGQVRPVQVIRFVMADTVEEKIIMLQDKKRKLVQGALGNMSKDEMREMMMQDLKSLFT